MKIYFAVTRAHGPGWDRSRGLREQAKWDEHAAFMDALVDEGFVVLGGPIGDGEQALLIVNTANEQDIEARFADDPWTPTGHLYTAKVERWQILLEG